jgi:hypothetical protein
MRPFVILLAAVYSLVSVVQAAADDESRRALQRSDVVFMYDNPQMYEPYGCTVLGWAGTARRERIEQAHVRGVRLFSTSIGFLTEFQRVIEFSDDFQNAAARNFAGETFVVPWLWDHKYQGQSAWWWCTNSPLYRQYLEEQLVQRMAARPDGLHIDDYRGSSGSVTWLSGCFCRHCLASFRTYLKERVPQAKLDALGVSDLDHFDYRLFLVDRGVTPEQYARERANLPLAAEFHDFHVRENTAYVAAYRRRAEAIRGGPLTLCVNSGLTDPQALAIAPHLSYFCCEVNHNAAQQKFPEHPIYIYKLADGLARPVASTANGEDWAFINEHGHPDLVRSWIGLSYAFGHHLMAPHRQWCYTQEKGTHWYDGPTEDFASLYRFVRSQARLLDGYEAAAAVTVLYDNAAARRGRGSIEPICLELARRNIPFTVVVAGDDWLDYRLKAESLASFHAVILPADNASLAWLDDEQKAILEKVRSQGKLMVWPDEAALGRLAPSPVIVEGSDSVMVVPRLKPADPVAPVAIHLVNRRYDASQEATAPQRSFLVRLRRDLLPRREFTKATLHAAGREPLPLTLVDNETMIGVHVPELGVWGFVELH